MFDDFGLPLTYIEFLFFSERRNTRTKGKHRFCDFGKRNIDMAEIKHYFQENNQ
jgi:hypothetical protein